MPFQPDLRLDGDAGARFGARVLAELEAGSSRTRKRRAADQLRHERTVSALLANLLTERRNRHSVLIFVAVPFQARWYSRTDLSETSMRALRDFLWAGGLIEGQRGYTRWDPWDSETVIAGHARRSRFRATESLLSWADEAGIDLSAPRGAPNHGVVRQPSESLVVIRPSTSGRFAGVDPGPEPESVKASRAIIAETNRLIAAADIAVAGPARPTLAAGSEPADDDELRARVQAGDHSAITLRRIFNDTWTAGGRVYGGFWQNMRKAERRRLTIDGEPTVELDYARLHPTLLYARAGMRLTFDPYLPAGFDPRLRPAGKATFGRLLNSDGPVDVARIRRPNGMPPDIPVEEYRRFAAALIRIHEPIASAFGTSASLALQFADSEMLLRVLDRMNRLGAAVLPIHDSVIVADRWADELQAAMEAAYRDVTGDDDIEVTRVPGLRLGPSEVAR
jgi:hypothetical protein